MSKQGGLFNFFSKVPSKSSPSVKAPAAASAPANVDASTIALANPEAVAASAPVAAAAGTSPHFPAAAASASAAAGASASSPSPLIAAKRARVESTSPKSTPSRPAAASGTTPPSRPAAAASSSAAAAASTSSASKRPRVEPLAPLTTLGAPLPRAAPDALADQVIVFSGDLDAITRDRVRELVVQFGGRSVDSVSGKTTMLVLGSKLEDGRPVESGSKWRAVEAENEKAAKGERKAGPIIVFKEEEFFLHLEASLGPEEAQKSKAARMGTGIIPDAASSFASSSAIASSRPSLLAASRADAGSGSAAGAASASAAGLRARAARAAADLSGSHSLWTQKYAPQGFADLVGHQAQVQALDAWIQNWEAMHIRGTMPLPPKSSRSNDGARAALLSGPPGIGKTTTAALLAKRHGYEVLEMNASDNRAARHVKEVLSGATSSATLDGRRRLIIMDEVDGMSGGDRGGNQELMKLIKDTKTPIIAICNDRQKPQVRSLANHCYDLKFARPLKAAIAARLADICAKEGLRVERAAVENLAESCGSDLRSMLNTLQMWAKRRSTAVMGASDLAARLSGVNKDALLRLDAFSAAPRLFSDAKTASLDARCELFFVDYDMAPLLVAQMYPDCIMRASPGSSAVDQRVAMQRAARAADAMSESDLIGAGIRERQQWGLLPHMAAAVVRCATVSACATPAAVMFPTWLAKNSSRTKRARLLAEFGLHLGASVSGGREAIRLDLFDPMRARLFAPLFKAASEETPLPSILETIRLLDEYGMSSDDLMETMTTVSFVGEGFPSFAVETRVKGAFTREYKRLPHKSQSLGMAAAGIAASITRGKRGGGSGRLAADEDGEGSDDDGGGGGGGDDDEDGDEGGDGSKGAAGASASAFAVKAKKPAATKKPADKKPAAAKKSAAAKKPAAAKKAAASKGKRAVVVDDDDEIELGDSSDDDVQVIDDSDD